MFYNGQFPKIHFLNNIWHVPIWQKKWISSRTLVRRVSASAKLCNVPLWTACTGLYSVFYSFTPATLTSAYLNAAGVLTHGGISKIWITHFCFCFVFFFLHGMSDFFATLLLNTHLALQHLCSVCTNWEKGGGGDGVHNSICLQFVTRNKICKLEGQ